MFLLKLLQRGGSAYIVAPFAEPEGGPVRCLIVLVIALLSLPASAAELRDVRLWASPEGTRIVFDLDGSADHSLFTLADPNRVVVDLKNTRRARLLAAKLEGKGLVQRVRSGAYDDGALRVVLDLQSPVSSRSFALAPNQSYGYRVVVDLAPEGAAAVPIDTTAAPAPAALPSAAIPASGTGTGLTPALALAEPPPEQPGQPQSSASLSPQSILDGADTPPAGRIGPRAARPSEKPMVIAIDAGHGGEDPGAQGKRGTLEKEVCLAVAKRLAGLINREPGLKAVLIRDGDYYIGLRQRVAKAQAARADLFVSIHANSFRDPKVRGTAVYVLSPKGANSAHAVMLENRENMSDLIGGVDVGSKDDATAAVLVDILQTSAMEASYDAGGRLLDAMGKINPLQKPQVQQAAFVVLKSASFPSVLIETAFITNDREERMLADAEHQDRLARSMLDGIRGYFDAYRPSQQVARREPPRAGGASLQSVSLAR